MCDPSVKKRWFSDLLGPDDGHLMGTFSSCNKQPLTACSRVSGFRAKQGEATDVVAGIVQSSECPQTTLIIQHEDWMELFTLERVSITPASFVLNFQPKQLNEKENSGDVSHGVLCLFLFNTKEYVCHWYVGLFCYKQKKNNIVG